MTTTNKTPKTTQKSALVYAINALRDSAPADVVEKLESMVAQIDKKNASPKKLTANQQANLEIRDVVVQFIRDTAPTAYTCADLIKSVDVLHERSNQYVSALMRKAVEADEVEKFTDKRRTYFRAK